MTTLKNILNSVCDDALEERATSYVSNQQAEYRRLVRYANKSVQDILTQHNWSLLKKRYSIPVVDGTTIYDLPSDFSYAINDTANTENGYRNIDFPATDQLVAYDDTWRVVDCMMRLIGNQVEVLNASEGNIQIMYISKGAISSNSTVKDYFDDDNDEWLLDDELLIRGILWRWQRAEGDDADWQTSLQDFKNHLDNVKGRDIAARTLNSDYTSRNKNLPFWVKEIR